jgi:hypothetical protein
MTSRSLVWILVMASGVLGGCAAPASTPAPKNNPAPSVTSLSPTSATAGGTSFNLTVNGSNFISSSVVQWNGSARTTAFVSASQLTAAIPAADIAAAGNNAVTVMNPAPGGGTSSALTFPVNPAPNPVPTLSSLSPSSATAGSAGFVLTVNGGNFVNGATVQWNSANRTTTFVNATQVTATIAAADIAAAGSAQVKVVNPAPGGGASNALVFTINAPVQTVGVVARVVAPLNPADPPSASGFQPSISGDGRYVTFLSNAANLVANDTNSNSDVFRRDTCFGTSAPAGCTPMTERISVKADGSQTQGVGFGPPAMSRDGRYVAFLSYDPALLPGGAGTVGGAYVRDTCLGVSSGCTPTTYDAALSDTGTLPDGITETTPVAISATGRYVVFASRATNLISGLTQTHTQIYLRDTCGGPNTPVAGCTPTTILVSASNTGEPANQSASQLPAVSGNGRFVVFFSNATNLVTQTVTHNHFYLRDTCVGAPAGCTASTQMVDVASNGDEGNGDAAGGAISDDGRYVHFQGSSTNLIAGGNVAGTFLRDTCIGAPAGCTATTSYVSLNPTGGTFPSGSLIGTAIGGLSADGRYAAFSVLLSSGAATAYVRDTCTGATGPCTPKTMDVTLDPNNLGGFGVGFVPTDLSVVISADGHFAAFGVVLGTEVMLALSGF